MRRTRLKSPPAWPRQQQGSGPPGWGEPGADSVGHFYPERLLAALGGVISAGRHGSGLPYIGTDMLLPVITAAVIGGTLLSGGVGSVAGTVIGAAIMGVLRNVLVVLQVNVLYQDVVLGFAVLVAVVIDQFRRGSLTLKLILGRR